MAAHTGALSLYHRGGAAARLIRIEYDACHFCGSMTGDNGDRRLIAAGYNRADAIKIRADFNAAWLSAKTRVLAGGKPSSHSRWALMRVFIAFSVYLTNFR